MMALPHGRARLCMAALAGLVISISAGGCGSPPKGPSATLHAYSKALDNGDYAAAYQLMSADFRDRHSKQEFIRMMKESSKEADRTAERLRKDPALVSMTAELRYGFGDRLELIREDDTWRIVENPVHFYSQATPREALRSFVRAYRLERWDIMLRFVPNLYRERMDEEKIRRQFEGEGREEIDVMMKMLGANLDAPITDKGDEARMPYGDRYEVKFIREDGLWKIRDIDGIGGSGMH